MPLMRPRTTFANAPEVAVGHFDLPYADSSDEPDSIFYVQKDLMIKQIDVSGQRVNTPADRNAMMNFSREAKNRRTLSPARRMGGDLKSQSRQAVKSLHAFKYKCRSAGEVRSLALHFLADMRRSAHFISVETGTPKACAMLARVRRVGLLIPCSNCLT